MNQPPLYNGPERRLEMNDVKTDIALIKQKSEFIEEKILEMTLELREIKGAFSEGELVRKKDLDAHSIIDRWLFALIFSTQIGIFVRMFIK